METLTPISTDGLQRWSSAPAVTKREVPRNGAAPKSPFTVNSLLNQKMCLWKGDQLALQVDGVVNATSEQQSDRSVLTRRISALSGDELAQAIARLEGCRTGEAKITPGFNLIARYVLHTVGPRYNVRYKTAAENALHSCYRGCLQLAKENKLESVAFCVINSDKRGYPKDEGAHIGLRTIRRCLEHYENDFEVIVFCVDSDSDFDLYSEMMTLYFPRNEQEYEYACSVLPSDCGNEWGETIIADRVIRVSNLNESDSEGDDKEGVASSWLTKDEVKEEKKSALTTMSPAKEERSAAPMTPEEAEAEQRYLGYLQKAQTTDLSEFDKTNCVYHSGHDSEGRPIVVFAPCRMKNPLPEGYMEKFTLYLLRVLDPLVNSNYVLVYFHSNMSDRDKPDFSWMKNIYEIFSWKYSRNLHRLLVVHPTFWLKIVNTFFKTFATADFFEKVMYLDSLQELFERVPQKQMQVLPEIFEYDRVENGTIWPAQSSGQAQKQHEEL